MNEFTKKTRAAEAIPARPIGVVVIGKVTYDNYPVLSGGDMTIGQMIDKHLTDTLNSGALVNEVKLFFETEQDQRQIQEMYMHLARKAY